MKNLAFLMAVLAMAGCSQQGGTEDQYNSDSGTRRSGTDTTSNNTYNATPVQNPNSSDTNLNNNSSGTTSTNTPSLPQ